MLLSEKDGSKKEKARLKKMAKSAKDKYKPLFSGMSLKKAKIYILDNNDKTLNTVEVQFNPSEYSISRGVALEKSSKLGKDTDGESQAIKGSATTLSLSLYFDNISKQSQMGLLEKAFKDVKKSVKSSSKKVDGGAVPSKAAANIIDLTTFHNDLHSPPKVRFVWGSLSFTGKVSSLSAQYTMFLPSGDPCKAKLDISIEGEETAKLLQSQASPYQSPDRTKSRTLVQGDQLWMMAHEEYDDPEKWKIIAKSNGILNPRSVEIATNLKVPSIK